VRNFWRRLRNSSQQKLQEFNEVLILVSVIMHGSSFSPVWKIITRLYIDVLEQLKLTAFNCDLVHSLFGKVDQFNFLQAHWALHRRSPPVKNSTAVRQPLWHWRTAIARYYNDFHCDCGNFACRLLIAAQTSVLVRLTTRCAIRSKYDWSQPSLTPEIRHSRWHSSKFAHTRQPDWTACRDWEFAGRDVDVSFVSGEHDPVIANFQQGLNSKLAF